jgi:hypothetical protein
MDECGFSMDRDGWVDNVACVSGMCVCCDGCVWGKGIGDGCVDGWLEGHWRWMCGWMVL